MKSKIIPELGITQQQVETIIGTIATSLVRDGHLSVEGKTPEKFLTELKNLIEKSDFHPVIDHTEDLLKQARAAYKEGKNEFACLLYALRIEHTLNRLVSSLAKRKGFSDKEIEEIVRDTSYRANSSWVLHLLGGQPFNKAHVNVIVKLMEARNSFVHYKWKIQNEQADNDLKTVISKIEKTIRYIRSYEQKYVLGVSKRRIGKMVKSA